METNTLPGNRLYTRKLILNPREFLKKNKELDDEEIARRIEANLGIKPNQLHLEFEFGHHYLSDNVKRKIDQGKYTLICGEFSDVGKSFSLSDDLANLKSANIFYRLLNPGEGGSTKVERQHHELIRALIKEGKSILTTDGMPWALEADGTTKIQSLPVFIAGAALVSLGSAAVLAKLPKSHVTGQETAKTPSKFTRRDFLQLAGITSAAGVASYIAKVLFFHDIIPPQNPLNDTMTDIISDADDSLQRLIQDPVFTTYSEGVITLRNCIMALNTWNVAARAVHQNEDKVNILFNAAGGHHNVRDEFLLGPTELEAKVTKFAERFLDETLPYLLSLENKSESEIVDLMVAYTDFFTQPNGSSTLGGPDLISTRTVMTPRAILVKEIDKRLAEWGKINDVSSEHKAKILKACLRNALFWEHQTDKEIIEAERSITGDLTTPEEIEATNFIVNSSIIIEDLSQANPWIETTDLIYGSANYQGLAYPLVRRFQLNNDTVVAYDLVRMYRGQTSTPLITRKFHQESAVTLATPFTGVVFNSVNDDGILADGSYSNFDSPPLLFISKFFEADGVNSEDELNISAVQLVMNN